MTEDVSSLCVFRCSFDLSKLMRLLHGLIRHVQRKIEIATTHLLTTFYAPFAAPYYSVAPRISYIC